MAKKTSIMAKAAYARYNTEGRRLKNKERNVLRHLKKHPNDKQASIYPEVKVVNYTSKNAT